MSTGNVIKLKPPAAKPARSRAVARKLRRQAAAAIGVGGVACVLTALSLNHLARGIGMVTGAAEWEAWSMAAGIDLGFVSLELAQLVVTTETVRRAVRRYCRPAITGTLAGSAALNALAFATQSTGWMLAPAIAMGLAIPALVYALTRIGATLYLDCSARG
jgi:hypothetical protein